MWTISGKGLENIPCSAPRIDIWMTVYSAGKPVFQVTPDGRTRPILQDVIKTDFFGWNLQPPETRGPYIVSLKSRFGPLKKRTCRAFWDGCDWIGYNYKLWLVDSWQKFPEPK